MKGRHERYPHHTEPTTSEAFLRPPELLEARPQRRARSRTPAAPSRIDHILRVLAKQKELGFEIFTDGELRRRNFMSDFTDAVEGFDLGDAVARTWKAGQEKEAPVSSVTGIVTAKLRAGRAAHRARASLP